MSNWNNIYVMTDSKGFKKMLEIARSMADNRHLQGVALFPRDDMNPNNFFDYYDELGHSVYFGFEAIFWNENALYVKMFMKVLEIADKNGVRWQFLRFGEHGIIERKVSDNFFDNPAMVMRVGATEVSFYRP